MVLAAVGSAESQPDTVAHCIRIEWIRTRRVEDELVVAHIEQHIEHALEHTRENAEAALGAVVVVAPGLLVRRPLVRVAVEERLSRQHERLQIEGSRGLRRARVAIQQIGATLERGRYGLSHRAERVLLALAQSGFHLPCVARAFPRQHQSGQT